MKVTFFGIGSATPHLERHSSACLVTIGNESILIDCGEGTQYRLLENKVKQSRISTICISHLHGDHYFGLVGLLSSWNLSQRKQSLTIFGPKNLEQIIKLQLESGNSTFSFPVKFIEVGSSKSAIIFESDFFKISTLPLIHRVPCTGFRIDTKNEKRKILVDKIPDDFPIVYYKLLQAGDDIYDELNSKIYLNKDYTKEAGKSKSFAYCSDTAYNESLLPLIAEVDLLYHEATFGDELESRAALTQHSTAREAARIAFKSKAKKLLLGHFSSRYKSLIFLEEEAREEFSNSWIIEQGKEYEI